MPSIRYTTVVAVVVAFVVAALVVRAAHAIVHRLLDALEMVGAENRAAVHARARQLIRALKLLAYGVAALASVSLALSRFGLSEPRWDPREVARWSATHGINGVAGTVEQINLRTIILRDGEGAVQVFPNGTITALANLSKQFAYAVVETRVAYSENIDRVMGTIREVGVSMERDPVWQPIVL